MTRPFEHYRRRAIDAVLAQLLQDHSAVMVNGPRATGKTTTCAQLANSALRLGDPGRVGSSENRPGREVDSGLERPSIGGG